MIHRALSPFLTLCVLGLAACDGGGDCTEAQVRILDPMPMQRITAADDADPSDATIQYSFVLEGTCLAEDELVELYLLSPAESLYGGGAVDAMGIYRSPPLPLIPGESRFVARSSVSGAESEELVISVAF